MRKAAWVIGVCVLCAWSVGVETQTVVSPAALAALTPREPSWAFPIQKGMIPELPPGPQSIPGSMKKYTVEEVDNLLAPPDWFPGDHPPAPAIVTKGHGGALACGSCHLMSGIGHPESADVTGMTFDYLMQQMKDFKSGDRKDWARMNGIAKELTDEETQRAITWMASLKPRRNNAIVEMDTVPKTIIAQGRMRFVDPAGGTEPAGPRILTLPVNVTLARLRDPNTAFSSYVAAGTLARGKDLVEKGNKDRTIIACGTCHGKTMTGQVLPRKDTPGIQVPRIAGQHPMYLTRQLYLIKEGLRGGDSAKLMAPTVKNMTDEDIVAIAAYLASLDPTAAAPAAPTLRVVQ
jgi:cytochrome c553